MVCFYLPPYLTARLADVNDGLRKTAEKDPQIRAVRERHPVMIVVGGVTVYDARSSLRIPGRKASASLKQADRVRQAADVVERCMKVSDFPDAVVRYGEGYANAFFDGEYLVFGQGDGEVFGDFTKAMDVAVHEMGHQMVARGPRLVYSGESGALNEHLADVFGICAAQFRQDQCEDWRLGQEVFLDGVSALRDMENPGSAYDTPLMGRDPQPDHMLRYVHTRDDNGGVHINSGIPNRAFVLFVQALGVPSWREPLWLWRDAMTRIGAGASFTAFAQAVLLASNGRWDTEVRAAWGAVGVEV